MLWSLFFIFGYVLSFVSVLADPETAAIGSRRDPNLFEFSDGSFSQIFWVMLAGMAGMAFAAKSFEKFYGRRRGLALPVNKVTDIFHRHLRLTLVFVLLSSIAIIGLMFVLGIGRTGLPPATALPFMLTGILVYTKNMIIPFLGFVVFVAAERTRDYNRIRTAFWMLLVIGAVGSVAFVSRGFFIFMVLPALIYMVCYGQDRKLSSRFFRASGLQVMGLLLVLIPAIELLRIVLFSGLLLSSLAQVDVSAEISILDAFAKIAGLATARIIGFRELVFITDYQQFDIWAPWRIFAGDEEYSEMLSFNLYGFQQDASGDTAFGYALGLWGMFYLTGSYIIVFLGSFVATSVVLAFEELFLKHSFPQLSLFMATNIGLWVWGGIDWFLLSRLLITALFCYFLVRYTRLSTLLR
jgi:hypothetical protein